MGDLWSESCGELGLRAISTARTAPAIFAILQAVRLNRHLEGKICMGNAKKASRPTVVKTEPVEEFDLVILGGGTGSTIAA